MKIEIEVVPTKSPEIFEIGGVPFYGRVKVRKALMAEAKVAVLIAVENLFANVAPEPAPVEPEEV